MESGDTGRQGRPLTLRHKTLIDATVFLANIRTFIVGFLVGYPCADTKLAL